MGIDRTANPIRRSHQFDPPRMLHVDSPAPQAEQLAAEELRLHLHILGIDSSITSQLRAPSIHLGSCLLPDFAAAAFDKVRDDGYLLFRRGADIYIAGKLARGTLYGAYSYLESLGLRWSEPGRPAEITSRTTDIATIPDEGINNPSFPIRGNNCYCPTNATDTKTTLAIVEWLTRQRYNFHSFLRQDSPALTGFDEYWFQTAEYVHQRGLEFGLGTHLAWPGLLMYEEDENQLFRKHPDFFELRNGTRESSSIYGHHYGPSSIAAQTGSGMSLCVSNPEVVELIAQNLRKFLDAHPEIDVMGLWPPDTQWEGCECTECRKLTAPERMYSGSPYAKIKYRSTPDLVARLASEVASRIETTHPKVRIVSWSWCTSEGAPQNVVPKGRFRLDHMYLPCFTHAIDAETCLHHHIHPDSWITWAKTPNIDFGWIFTGSPHIRVVEFPFAWLIKKTIDFLHRIGGKAITYNLEIGPAEHGNIAGDQTDHYLFSNCGINYYILGRSAWNFDSSLSELFADFAEARFGASAGQPMAEYYRQTIPEYEDWQHSQSIDGAWMGPQSEIRCRVSWEAVMEIFKPLMIAKARKLLEQAEDAAVNPDHNTRVKLERNMFEYTILQRQVYYIQRARKELEQAGAEEYSKLLRDRQLELLDDAKKIPLHKYSEYRQGHPWDPALFKG